MRQPLWHSKLLVPTTVPLGTVRPPLAESREGPHQLAALRTGQWRYFPNSLISRTPVQNIVILRV
jgi:hypothetical protein